MIILKNHILYLSDLAEHAYYENPRLSFSLHVENISKNVDEKPPLNQ